MDFFTKNRLLFWCVGVLLLLNVVTLASFWLRRPPLGPPGGPGGRRGGQRIMEERLQLSDEQARQFKQIRDEHFLRTIPLGDEIHEIRLDLLDEVFAPDPNETTIQDMTAKIGRRQCQFERQLFHHFQELRNVCTDQQAPELRHLLTGLLESARSGGLERPPQGPERGPGPGHPAPPPPR